MKKQRKKRGREVKHKRKAGKGSRKRGRRKKEEEENYITFKITVRLFYCLSIIFFSHFLQRLF